MKYKFKKEYKLIKVNLYFFCDDLIYINSHSLSYNMSKDDYIWF